MKKKYFLGVLLVSVILIAGCGKEEVLETSKEETLEVVEAEKHVAENEPENESEDKKNAEIQFPVILEDGKIEIESLFQYDGINPDCDNVEGKGIAAIELINHSTECLKKAKISLLLSDESEIKFEIMEVPAGKRIMAFSTENVQISSDVKCVDVKCEAEYENASLNGKEKIAVSVEGINITLTNLTGEEISECRVHCHSTLGEMLFGGISYQYVVNSLSPNESVVVEATDCILGMAEIVCLDVN